MNLLAQILPAAPEPLPSPPFLERFVLDSPMLLTIILVAIGAITLFAQNRRGQASKGLLGLVICVALAVAAWLAASLVETDRERLKSSTRRLIASVADVDLQTLDSLLAENVTLRYRNARQGLAKEGIIADVERYMGGQYAVSEHRVLNLQATTDSTGIGRTQVNVGVDLEEFGNAPTSWWLVHWRLDSDERWRVTSIEPLHPWIRAD